MKISNIQNFLRILHSVAFLLGILAWTGGTTAEADTQYANVANMAKAGTEAAFGGERIDISIDNSNPYANSTLNARFVTIKSSMNKKSNSFNTSIQRGSGNIVGIGWGGDDDVVTNLKIKDIANFPVINAKKDGDHWDDSADDNPSCIIWTNDRTSAVVIIDDDAYKNPGGWDHNKGYYFKVFPWNPSNAVVHLTFDLYLYGDSKKYYTGGSPGEDWHQDKLDDYYDDLDKDDIDDPDWVRGIFFWSLIGNIESFLPSIEIQAIDGSAKEATTDTALVRVTRTDNAQLPLSVGANWETSPPGRNDVAISINGTAVNKSFTINFASGQTTQDLVIKALQDNVFDPGEKVIVSLVPNANYKLQSSSASADIIDNTPLIATVFASKPNAYLPNVAGEFEVDLNTTATIPITVNYAVGGTAPPNVRYQALPGSVLFQPGQKSFRIPVIPIENHVVTPTQTVILTLVAGVNYGLGSKPSATVFIIDDNDNVFSIVTDNATATPKGAPARFHVVRAGTNLAPITLDWNITGTAIPSVHYSPALPSSVFFGDGVREVAFSLDAIPSPPPNRNVVITLKGAPRYTLGSPGNATLTIVAKLPVTHVNINATIFSGATTPANAVDSWVPEGVSVKGGIIALGNGNVPQSAMPAKLTPQLEYLNGAWIPPVVPYGIDVRIKQSTLHAQ